MPYQSPYQSQLGRVRRTLDETQYGPAVPGQGPVGNTSVQGELPAQNSVQTLGDMPMAPPPGPPGGQSTPGEEMFPGGEATGGADVYGGETVTAPDEQMYDVAPPVEGGADDDGLGQESQDFLAELLGMGLAPDTAEQEALMQAQSDRVLGQGLMDQRASAGAAGFGESGALMALEGNMRSDAARALGLDINELRASEQQRMIDNALEAIDADVALRGVGFEEALRGWLLEQSGMGDPSGPGGEGDPPGSYYDAEGNLFGPDGNIIRSRGAGEAGDERTSENAHDRANYPDGEEAWDVAQQAGTAAAMQYSMDNDGDFSGLPPGAPDERSIMLNNTGPPDNIQVWWNPDTGELFREA